MTGFVETHRGCVYKTSRTDMCDLLKDTVDMDENLDLVFYCYTCDSDLCNSATTFNMFFNVMLISVVTIFFSR